MRVVVDLNRCQGYAQCVFLAPDVFELHGEEALLYDLNPDDAQRVRVMYDPSSFRTAFAVSRATVTLASLKTVGQEA